MDANRTKIGIIKEATYNLVPASPAFEILRVTGADLAYTPRTVVSSELRSDGQVPDLIRVGYESGGRLPMEVSYSALDTVAEGALRSVWTSRWLTKFNAVAGAVITAVDAAADTYAFTGGQTPLAGEIYRMSGFINAQNNGIQLAIAGSAAGSLKTVDGRVTEVPPAGARIKRVGTEFAAGVITAGAIVSGQAQLIRSGGSWITDGFVAGEWLKVGGPAAGSQFTGTPANNGWVRIAAGGVSALTLLLDIYPVGWAADAAAAKTIRIYYGEYMRNGITVSSYTIEETFEDLTVPEYHMYSGMQVNTLTMEAGTQAILTAVADFIGASASILTARTGGASDLPQQSNEVLNTSSNVGRLAENGADLTGSVFVTAATLEINNNLRRRNAVGQLGSFGVGTGRFVLTGRLSTYYQSKTLLDKLRAGTATSYDLRVMDPDGSRALVVDVPRLKFTTGAPTVPGVDSDRMLELPFQGLRHPTFGYTMHMQRFEGIE